MTNQIADNNNTLYVESVAVNEIAKAYGTPVYVYSKAMLADAFGQYVRAFDGAEHRVCFAVKVNSNLSILKLLGDLSAGFDIVSGGELARVIAAGCDTSKVVFSGVGKTAAEIAMALDANIACFNVESLEELNRIDEIARQKNKIAPIALRINPDVDPKTHPYISTGMEKNKFGLNMVTAEQVYLAAAKMPNIHVEGISCHIGSQLTEISPFMDAIDRVLDMVDKLGAQGIELKHLDIGGGLGIVYDKETPPSIAEWVSVFRQKVGKRNLMMMIEPGRSITAKAGILATRVEYIKQTPKKTFVVVDAAMNDLMRPALYQAWHTIRPVDVTDTPEIVCDVVGPICESTDRFGEDRQLSVLPNSYLAIMDAGAYGEAMSSNYNSRPRPASVLVDGDQTILIRQRESFDDLFSLEKTGLITK